MKTKIIHMMVNDHEYYCIRACKVTPEKMTGDWNKVTCQNCLIIGGKMKRFKEAMKERGIK